MTIPSCLGEAVPSEGEVDGDAGRMEGWRGRSSAGPIYAAREASIRSVGNVDERLLRSSYAHVLVMAWVQ